MMATADSVDAAIRRGHEYCRAGRFNDAAACLVTAIRSHPASLTPYRLLADVHRSMGNRPAEAAVLDELTSREPLNAETWMRLASVHAQLGRWEEAYRAYRQACGLRPDQIEHWQGLGGASLSSQRFLQAVEARDELLQRFPAAAPTQLLAAHVQKALGNREGARALYDAALSLDPDSSEAVYNRIDLDPPPPDDALALRLEQRLASSGLDDADLANLSFASARILDASHRFDEAFARYKRANDVVKRIMAAKGILYRPADTEAWVAGSLAAYPSATQQHLEPLSIDLRLIFIVGMPRSGTSMLEEIVAGHPRVAAGGELTLAGDSERSYLHRRREMGLQGPIDTRDAKERELLLDVRQSYVDRLLERDLDADYVTDKLPGNFSRLGFIRLLFPDAVIVHCRRHPVATCWSLFTSNFAMHDPYYNSLEHLVHYYRCYERLMSHWRSMANPPLVEIRYEDLVSSPQAEIRRLIQEIGLDWRDECMDFHHHRRPVLTASCLQIRTPIYGSSIDRWRHYESNLGALMELCP